MRDHAIQRRGASQQAAAADGRTARLRLALAPAAERRYVGRSLSQAHVFAVASGFGLRIIPIAPPYEFALGPETNQLDISRQTPHGRRFARLTPDAGGYSSEIAHGTPSLADVVEVVRGPAHDSWWIDTSVYRILLPPDWKVNVSGDPTAPTVFDLFGAGDAMMFVQSPQSVPDPDQLCAPGQRIHAQGSDAWSRWIELRYWNGESEWVQRHDILRVGRVACVLTLQAPVATVPTTVPAHRIVLESIAPGGDKAT